MSFLNKLKWKYAGLMLKSLYGSNQDRWFMRTIIYRIPFFKNIGTVSIDDFDIIRYRGTDVGSASKYVDEVLLYHPAILRPLQFNDAETLTEESRDLVKIAYFILTYVLNPKCNKEEVSKWFKSVGSDFDPMDFKYFSSPVIADSDNYPLPTIKATPIFIMTRNGDSLHGTEIQVYDKERSNNVIKLRVFLKNDMYYYDSYIGNNMKLDVFYVVPFLYDDFIKGLKRVNFFQEIIEEFSSTILDIMNNDVDENKKFIFDGKLPTSQEKSVYDMIQYT